MNLNKFKKPALITIGALIGVYVVSLFFWDTNNIINCHGKDINGTLSGSYSMQDIADKGRSMGYSVEHFPEDISVAKDVGNKYFQKFILYSPKEGSTKWNILLTYGSGYCKIKDSTAKNDASNFLSEFNIDSEWLQNNHMRVFDYRPMFDFLPHISL